MQVSVRDNNVEQALRALKKKLQREGVFREMKLKQHFEKPSVKKAREKAEAVRRARKLERKRAERDGNRIYAVISGLGSYSDGRSKSIYAPVAAGQRVALDRAYADAECSPSSVERTLTRSPRRPPENLRADPAKAEDLIRLARPRGLVYVGSCQSDTACDPKSALTRGGQDPWTTSR